MAATAWIKSHFASSFATADSLPFLCLQLLILFQSANTVPCPMSSRRRSMRLKGKRIWTERQGVRRQPRNRVRCREEWRGRLVRSILMSSLQRIKPLHRNWQWHCDLFDISLKIIPHYQSWFLGRGVSYFGAELCQIFVRASKSYSPQFHAKLTFSTSALKPSILLAFFSSKSYLIYWAYLWRESSLGHLVVILFLLL